MCGDPEFKMSQVPDLSLAIVLIPSRIPQGHRRGTDLKRLVHLPSGAPSAGQLPNTGLGWLQMYRTLPALTLPSLCGGSPPALAWAQQSLPLPVLCASLGS